MPHAQPQTKAFNMSPDGRRRRMETAQRLGAYSVQSPDSEDPRIAEAQKRLGLMLAEYRSGYPALDTRSARDMQQIVHDYREACKRKGVVLPKMRLVYFVKMSHICVWPQDLEHADMQKRIQIFVTHRRRHNLAIDVNDIAEGVRRAYPDYSPSRQLILPTTLFSNPQQEISQ